jgi:hypothetical protein
MEVSQGIRPDNFYPEGRNASMVATDQIKEHMPVVCSEGGQFAKVDHLDAGNSIKLTKDNRGQHHWIPLDWVTEVNDSVHVDRPGGQAMQDWMDQPPAS